MQGRRGVATTQCDNALIRIGPLSPVPDLLPPGRWFLPPPRGIFPERLDGPYICERLVRKYGISVLLPPRRLENDGPCTALRTGWLTFLQKPHVTL